MCVYEELFILIIISLTSSSFFASTRSRRASSALVGLQEAVLRSCPKILQTVCTLLFYLVHECQGHYSSPQELPHGPGDFIELLTKEFLCCKGDIVLAVMNLSIRLNEPLSMRGSHLLTQCTGSSNSQRQELTLEELRTYELPIHTGGILHPHLPCHSLLQSLCPSTAAP